MIISIKMSDGTRYDVKSDKMIEVPEQWLYVPETPEKGSWLNTKYIISITAKGDGE